MELQYLILEPHVSIGRLSSLAELFRPPPSTRVRRCRVRRAKEAPGDACANSNCGQFGRSDRQLPKTPASCGAHSAPLSYPPRAHCCWLVWPSLYLLVLHLTLLHLCSTSPWPTSNATTRLRTRSTGPTMSRSLTQCRLNRPSNRPRGCSRRRRCVAVQTVCFTALGSFAALENTGGQTLPQSRLPNHAHSLVRYFSSPPHARLADRILTRYVPCRLLYLLSSSF